MALSKHVQKQSQELYHIAESIKSCAANKETVKEKSNYLSQLIQDLNKKSQLSFSEDDKASLLKILKDSDEETKAEIQMIINENLAIEKNVDQFSKIYEERRSILSNPEEFIKNSMKLHADLMQRILFDKKLQKPLNKNLN